MRTLVAIAALSIIAGGCGSSDPKERFISEINTKVLQAASLPINEGGLRERLLRYADAADSIKLNGDGFGMNRVEKDLLIDWLRTFATGEAQLLWRYYASRGNSTDPIAVAENEESLYALVHVSRALELNPSIFCGADCNPLVVREVGRQAAVGLIEGPYGLLEQMRKGSDSAVLGIRRLVMRWEITDWIKLDPAERMRIATTFR